MTKRERQLAALCEEMVEEFDRINMTSELPFKDCGEVNLRYRLRLDRLTKRKK